MKTIVNKREFELCKKNLHRLQMGHTYGFYECYKNPSEAKIKAFEAIIQEMFSDNRIYICAAGVTAFNVSTFTFSCTYYNIYTGEARIRVYTKNNTYDISAALTYDEYKKLYKEA